MGSDSDDKQAAAWRDLMIAGVLVALLLAGMVTCTVHLAKHLK
jgi:hypothetical protein